jgi:hypothetical protein
MKARRIADKRYFARHLARVDGTATFGKNLGNPRRYGLARAFFANTRSLKMLRLFVYRIFFTRTAIHFA